MADFSSDVNPVGGSRFYPRPNPVNTSTASAIQSGANILGAIGTTLVKGMNDAALQAAQDRKNAVHSQLDVTAARLAQATAQGKLRADVAGSRLRTAYIRLAADHPEMADDLSKQYVTLTGSSGVAGNINAEISSEREMEKALLQSNIQKAIDAGLTTAIAPREEQIAAVEANQKIQAADKIMAEKKARLELDTAKVNLTNARLTTTSKRQTIANNALTHKAKEIDLLKKRYQYDIWRTAIDKADGGYNQTVGRIGVIMGNIGKTVVNKETGQSHVQTKDEALDELRQLKIEVEHNSAVTGLQMGNTGGAAALVKPILDHIDLAIAQVNGKITADRANQEAAAIEATHKAQILNNNPRAAHFISMSKLIPLSSGVQKNLNDIAFGMLNAGAKEPPPNGDKPHRGVVTKTGDKDYDDAVETSTDLIIEGIKKISSGDAPDRLKTETKNQFVNLLDSVAKYGQMDRDPKNYTTLVSRLASPSVGQYMKKNPDIAKGEAAQGASNIIHNNYTMKVIPIIQDDFLNSDIPIIAKGGMSRTIKTKDYVSADFNGVSMHFTSTSNSPLVQAKVRELNSTVSPLVNNLVRASAHLEGSDNYQAAYDKLIEPILNKPEEEKGE